MNKKNIFLTFSVLLVLLSVYGCSDDGNTSSDPQQVASSSSDAIDSTFSSSSSVDIVSPFSSAITEVSSSSEIVSELSSSSSVISELSSSSSVSVDMSSSSSVDTEDRLGNITKTCGSLMPARISGGSSGWGSRYWDCCKPSCSWRENVDTTANPFSICKNCDIDNQEISAFVESPNVSQYWFGYEGTKSGCQDGGVAYTCFDHAPYAVCDSLAYGYAAVPASDSKCGKCFQVEFDGGTHNGSDQVKETHKLLKGKIMIVLASNIGGDVAAGQFDLLIPGGGVGQFNGCSKQWGVTDENLFGATYGGLLTSCQSSLGYDATASKYETCVTEKCNALFGSNTKLTRLLEGCLWFAQWMHAADNPTFTYKEVECPQELTSGYRSTINTTKDKTE